VLHGLINIMYTKNSFVEVSKSLARYKSEKIFMLYSHQNNYIEV